MTPTAPFTITHHDEASSWHDSPVLLALVGLTVVVTTKEGYIFDGEVESVNDDGTIVLANLNLGNSWKEMTIDIGQITNIHYC
jgi:hypothetical protein